MFISCKSFNEGNTQSVNPLPVYSLQNLAGYALGSYDNISAVLVVPVNGDADVGITPK